MSSNKDLKKTSKDRQFITEELPITITSVRNQLGAKVNLSKIAIASSVRVELNNEVIIPIGFDFYGNPLFSREQAEIFIFKEEEEKRRHLGESFAHKVLKVKVSYLERPINLLFRSDIDSVEGIKRHLNSLNNFNCLIEKRAIFQKAFPKIYLNEFVIFGYIILDSFGQINFIDDINNKLKFSSDVEMKSDFLKENNNAYIEAFYYSGGLPNGNRNSKCNICGNKYTMDDLKNHTLIFNNGIWYHKTCFALYSDIKETDFLTRIIMNRVYNINEYTYMIVPNEYTYLHNNLPWICFNTIDGDITVGKRKRVYSIEWHENYKKFDFDKIFKDENVTKINENNTRVIHAWTQEKLVEYLLRARNNK